MAQFKYKIDSTNLGKSDEQPQFLQNSQIQDPEYDLEKLEQSNLAEQKLREEEALRLQKQEQELEIERLRNERLQKAKSETKSNVVTTK